MEKTLATTPEGQQMQKNPSIFNFSLVKVRQTCRTEFPRVADGIVESVLSSDGSLVRGHYEACRRRRFDHFGNSGTACRLFDGAPLSLARIFVFLNSSSLSLQLDKYPNLNCMCLYLYPTTPTNEYTPPVLSGKSTSWFNWVNSLKWTMADKGAWSLWSDELNKHRAKNGLKPVKEGFRDYLAKLRTPEILSLTAYSTHLVPRPKDWSNSNDQIPPMFPDPDQRDFKPAKRLVKFLDPSKPKPICTFLYQPSDDELAMLTRSCPQSHWRGFNDGSHAPRSRTGENRQ